MLKSTLFIAVQCCQCSTMQVKQQKKSSNKWNCVVCDQKQSVKVVYAQGYQAKDIRNFVQSFNMSRKLRDDQLDQQQFPFVEDNSNNSTEEKKSKRRTDWSEYIEDGSSSFEPAYLKVESNEKEMVAEQNIVTDFTEDLMFKKRILKRKFSSPADKEANLSKREMGGKCCDIVNDDDLMSEQQQQKNVSTTSAWKWNKYIEEDDNGNDGQGVRVRAPISQDDFNIMLQFQGMDQPVEDDIHPVFI